jgi:hypothetical protein
LPGLSIRLETTGTTPGGIPLGVPSEVPTPIALETGGTGSITLQAGANQNIQTGHLATSGGDISVQAGGQVELNHAVVESNGGDIILQGGSTGFYAGSGVYIHNDSRIDAASGALTISGTSYTDAGVKVSNSGDASSTLLSLKGHTIQVTGRTEMGSSGLHLESADIQATDAVTLEAQGGGLLLTASRVHNLGSGPMQLSASGWGDTGLTIDADSQISNLGGTSDILLQANAVQINGAVDAGDQARVTVKPSDTARVMVIGGTDAAGQLNLTADELGHITAKVLVLGSSAHAGGLVVESSVVLPATQVQALSLIQSNAGSIAQKSRATLQVERLNADAGFVNLQEDNQIQFISGRARDASGFNFTSAAPSLTIGTVDGVSGVVSGMPDAPAPIHISLTGAGATLAQDSNAPLEGSAITLAGPGGAEATLAPIATVATTTHNVTLSKVQAHGQLSLSGWNSVLLTGETQFDNLSFPGGSLTSSSTAVWVPGGRDRIVNATVDVAQMVTLAVAGNVSWSCFAPSKSTANVVPVSITI